MYIYIYIRILQNLNGCIKSNSCPRPVSLNYCSGAEEQHLKTTLEQQLKNVDCVKGSPFLHIELMKLMLSYIHIIQFKYTSILYIYIYIHTLVYILIQSTYTIFKECSIRKSRAYIFIYLSKIKTQRFLRYTVFHVFPQS